MIHKEPVMNDHHNIPVKSHNADEAVPHCKQRYNAADTKHANGAASLVRKPIDHSTGMEYEKCSYAFFPGCQLSAAEPEIVIKAYDSILFQHPDTAIFLKCCGLPAIGKENTAANSAIDDILTSWKSLGEPTVITPCMVCLDRFRSELPQIPIISLYELLIKFGISGGCNSTDYRLLESCASQRDEKAKTAVTELAEDMGVKLRTVKDSGIPYITYCIDCRDILKEKGEDAVHIMELIYGMGKSNTHMIHEHEHEEDHKDEPECNGNCAACDSACGCPSASEPEELPSYEERLANRMELKQMMLALFWNENV